ncbi:MAG: twin-arginine translocase subunit TatC [Actinomycetota bacterium]|nr:twin-arginine translocase subunit TatC [Actinomycetota bacterium]
MAIPLVGAFSARPQHPVGNDGRMALSDHFRELRARLMRSVLVIIVGIVVALFFYSQLFEFVTHPYREALAQLNKGIDSRLISSDVGGPLMIQLKLCTFVAIGATAPYWLYQIWAFILPGLHARERKWTRVFVGVAGPLFLAGMALGYYIMPKGLAVLIGFTQTNVQNLVDVGRLITFMTQMLLVFGLSFEIPLFVVLLNAVGVVSGETLARHRPWIIVGTFVFAAVATPSTDPFSMCFLAVPMVLLFVISESIARTADRGRRRREEEALPLDEASPI